MRMISPTACLAVAVASVAVAAPRQRAAPSPAALADRVTWGANGAELSEISRVGETTWLARQLHPAPDAALPPGVQAQIDAMAYLQAPMIDLVRDVHTQQAAANAMTDPLLKAAAMQVANKAMDETARQATARSILRDLYSPDQLTEQMTWFWVNHFNILANKANLRLMVGDYEDRAIRPHALGRFRDLLEATLRHPAMIVYLDNAANAVGHVNENYAREIMELHTLGVGAGYGQQDVQELARILTGVGYDANEKDPQLPPKVRGQLIREGLFEFNPARHDYGDKVFLGHEIRGRGFAEVEEALDILARNPATARHISRELAVYFVSDDPPPALVERMRATFLHSDGDIAKVLETLFRSPEFAASLGTRFKDPVHYAISSVRLAYDDKVILDPGPVMSWIGRMGEGLYGRDTPDGYAMATSAWNGPGQMETRFEIARQIGSSTAGLFKSATPGAVEPTGAPDIEAAAQAAGLMPVAAPATRAVLAQAASPKDWNTLFLSSPAFMWR
jgi:uncharacterized protein (DUF1800 family)